VQTDCYELMLVGDLILDEPHPDEFFDCSRHVLAKADVLVGHVEVPHTTRGRESTMDVPAPASDPDNLYALKRAGFHVATLAGNHIFDAGPNGIEDTVRLLRSQDIQTTGAGMNLDEALTPAFVERNGVRFGFLSYNFVGSRESWATPAKAGCAYVKVITHYELDYATPGGPPTIYSFPDPPTLDRMQRQIEYVRGQVDVLAVAQHKGLGHTPATLAMYERIVAKAAIDAGADIVVGHHAHILQGVETYKGKPIFHGLGNFVTVTGALSVDVNSSPARLEWAQRRRKLYRFEPDPNYPIYPFHPEARNAIIASCEVGAGGVRRAGFYPCWIQPNGAPKVLANDERGRAVASYMEKITRESGLHAAFRWEGDRVVFLEN
jgi:poly-gamma-glutamate capsule biosynthesis protein CapA/YwtB (metallophosphatase superfamily)